jgi:hypothetical protein
MAKFKWQKANGVAKDNLKFALCYLPFEIVRRACYQGSASGCLSIPCRSL